MVPVCLSAAGAEEGGVILQESGPDAHLIGIWHALNTL